MTQKEERKKKETIIDLAPYIDKRINIKFQGGREASGILKGYDSLLNMVLDQATEFLHDQGTEQGERNLGLIVARGTAVTVVAPADGMEQIANPFANEEE